MAIASTRASLCRAGAGLHFRQGSREQHRGQQSRLRHALHALHDAIGINAEGFKDVLGLWLEKTEGAKFWLSVLTELKNRGVQDVLIAS